MHFQHSQPRSPSGSVYIAAQYPETQSPYPNAGYRNTAGFLPPHTSTLTLPQTPLPEYQAYDGRSLNPNAAYAGPYVPPPNIPDIGVALRHQQSTRRVSAWASTSTLDVARPRTAGAWGHGQVEHSQQDCVTRPSTSGNAANCAVARGMNQAAALCDRLASRFNHMRLAGTVEPADVDDLEALAKSFEVSDGEEDVQGSRSRPVRGGLVPAQRQRPGSGVLNSRKAWMYQNSRLPPGMVPWNVYLPTWTLVCRAAQASHEVYHRPKKDGWGNYTGADPKQGTKATIIKSQTVDDRKLLIVAIRGSQWNIVDWTVNFAISPTPPVGFLDDEGNACHAGFLEVARAMVTPVAAQLRSLVEHDPSWATSSLMFTGHSAGGAVASLLYMHVLAKTVVSDLTALTGLFRRKHCVTFGVPPLSLLPLHLSNDKSHAKNLFLSFANEGDLIVRADFQYLLSLAKLYAAPAPSIGTRQRLRERVSRQNLGGDGPPRPSHASPPRWPVPDASLSTAGRMVLLRERPDSRTHAIEAVQVADGELRGVIFGDRKMHAMALYKQRIDDLAFAAVSGREAG